MWQTPHKRQCYWERRIKISFGPPLLLNLFLQLPLNLQVSEYCIMENPNSFSSTCSNCVLFLRLKGTAKERIKLLINKWALSLVGLLESMWLNLIICSWDSPLPVFSSGSNYVFSFFLMCTSAFASYTVRTFTHVSRQSCFHTSVKYRRLFFGCHF